uniref:PR domain zinc finger protein 1-like n=1 Tax=Diabrotica virgifera virgifera TaxID=50390 RepID=A0A6P7GLC8_DIAVI
MRSCNAIIYPSIRPGKKPGDPGDPVTDLRILQYRPEGKIYYKLKYTDEFVSLPVRPQKQDPVYVFPKLFKKPLNITLDKWRDLQSLKSMMSYPQEENKMELMETVTEYSSDEGNYMGRHAEGKTLNKNVKVRTQKETFKCEICSKQAITEFNLKRHMIMHTGKKPYKCEICLTQFSQKIHLKTHLRVHTEQNLYK